MIKYTVEVYANGTKIWYRNDQLHREDGPAAEYASGTKYWCLNGENLTEEEFNARMNPSRKVAELTVAEISKLLGYEVKVVR